MDRKEFSKLIFGAGLRLANTGVVHDTDSKKDFGLLREDSFQTIGNEYIPLDDINAVNYTPSLNMMEIVDAGGGIITSVEGRKYSEEDMEAIPIHSMPATVSDLVAVLPSLYPDIGTQVYYDELSEKDMIDMSIFDRSKDGIRPINDKIIAVYYSDLENRLKQNGYFGRPPSFEVRNRALDVFLYNNRRNLFREWVESHEWDGKPRLRTWFRDLFGATAPPLAEMGLEDRYLGDVAEAWFIGGIRRMYLETKHEIVPVLIGSQGIGKGEALRFTAGSDYWFKDTNTNLRDIGKFLDGIRGNIIVELSESKQLRNEDSETLKSFISQSSDQMRKAYAHYDERYPRRFILAASSNLDNIFTDITGNRRYFPMYCDPTKATLEFSQDRSIGQYEVEQLWAEALHMYRNGGKWYLTADSANIARVMQEFGTQENSNITVIDEWLDNPDNGYDKLGATINKSLIMQQVFHIPDGEFIPFHAENAFRAWANAQRAWVKVAHTIRVNGKVCRGYERRLRPGESGNVVRLRMVSPNAPKDETDPVEFMRAFAEKHGLTGEAGESFPAEHVPVQMLDRLLDAGLIYDIGYASSPNYRVALIP